MTVSTNPRRVEYTGDGSTTEFAVPFQFYEISVYVDGALQGAGSDYNVSQEEPGLTGDIVFIALNGATPPNDSDVVILGTTSVVQGVDYVNNDDFPAEVLEGALDRLTMIGQEQNTKLETVVRGVLWHDPIAPLDFRANPGTIIFVDENGQVSLQSAEQILGGIDIQDAIDAANAADASADAAAASASAANASAIAAAASAAIAAAATEILDSDTVWTGRPTFEIGARFGKNGSGNSYAEFYDDTNNTWRFLYWDDVAHDWKVEDAGAAGRALWHSGNFASQAEAEAGAENTKGMTALRVAQAISALAGDGAFPAGTQLLSGNSSAPAGWTKLTDLNDYGIRLTSGSVSTSGAFGYSTVFASRTPTGTVNGMTLDTSRIPSHKHAHEWSAGGQFTQLGAFQGGANFAGTQDTGNTGGGGSHDHGFTGTPMAFNVQTRDVTMIEKD